MSFGCDCATIRRGEASGGAVGQEPTQAVSVAVCVEDWRRHHEVSILTFGETGEGRGIDLQHGLQWRTYVMEFEA